MQAIINYYKAFTALVTKWELIQFYYLLTILKVKSF